MKIKASIFFSVFFLLSQFILSQNQIEFKQLVGENVSTQSITYAIAQDSIGNIWVASEEGVLKHNSKFYKVYNSYNGLPEEVSNRVTKIFIDSKGHIWIGLEKGVCVYDENLDLFKIVSSDADINPSLITCISEDDSGNVWIGGFNGLWKYGLNDNQSKLVRVLSNQNIQALFPYKRKILFGTSKGLFVYNTQNDILNEIPLSSKPSNISFIGPINDYVVIGTKTGELYKTDLNFKQGFLINFDEKNPITDVIKKDSNTLYLGTDGDGLYKLDNSFSILDHYVEDANDQYSLSSNGIYDIVLGKENIVWIATYGGGVNYFDSNGFPFQKIQHRLNDKNSLVANFTRSLAKDSNGNLWFGTKKGVSIWSKKSNKWTHIPSFDKTNDTSGEIVLALEPSDEYMWVGTYNDGIFKININTLKSTQFKSLVQKDNMPQKVYTIFKDNNSNIWYGGIDGYLTKITKTNEVETYPIQQIKSISQIQSGNILAAGRYGVYSINDKTKHFELIDALSPNKNTLAYSTINSVIEIQNNMLVLGTNGEGVIFYNPNDKSVKKLKINSGMPSDIVQGVIAVSDSNFWASTTKGLVNIQTTKEDTIINVFDKRDGLTSTEFNYGSYAKLGDSLFAFGGVDGVTIFNPYNIKGESFKPKLVFDEFKLFNKAVKPGERPLFKHINETKSITLKHNENSIEIGFTGILHSSSSKIKYQYKLEGFDEQWSTPSHINFATYTNLSPGEYVFRVKAYNKFSEPGEERQLNIKVLSPWWATDKAYVIYFLALIGIVIAIIHFTSVIIKKKNADEQIDFFNNITHEIKTPLTILISSLDNITDNEGSGEDSKKRIKNTVKRINSLFEQMLHFQTVTSSDNLSIDVSQIDLDKHIKRRVNNFEPLTKENNLEVIINNNWDEPSFYFDKDIFDKIFLNLISNAIKYSFKNGKITINLTKTSLKELKIEIADEGLGIPKDQQKFILNRYYRARNVINSQRPGTGLGLMMVKKLLEKTGGSISFKSEENKGTTFTVILKNLKYEYNKKIDSLQNTVEHNDLLEDQTEIEEFSDSKILIVEDNDELRDLLVKTLGVYFQIFEASNGKEGLETASQIFPDIILTDLIMPEMDGMQMSRILKNDINLNHIPVFMLTVLQNSAQKLESIETGISEYIEKPIDMKFLFAKIVNTLKWQKKLREKYVHDNDADNATVHRNKHDQEFLQNLEETIIKNIENESFSVHDLSNSFNMSRTSLYMKLKNLVDLSPQDFIIHTKLKLAKKLLIEGEYSIKEIAYHSGFSNPKYFSTSFKKFYDITPSAFLESLKKEQ
ncbi:hybrid sensor histidine kinase/response regulator transcription factor [Yeosuana aromativorans]|uniref:hybrid sensor histidine kinase/response regulator transcription factor n=1 Tax=Yeosuana aromativorans TaxID=288019 RepID=UPI0016678EFB|nr:two-component regulator propeller domain-containing protein [Yeosuana aromativorans]